MRGQSSRQIARESPSLYLQFLIIPLWTDMTPPASGATSGAPHAGDPPLPHLFLYSLLLRAIPAYHIRRKYVHTGHAALGNPAAARGENDTIATRR